jgi:diguanylate cyclase (GGDEF)-like protein
VTRFGWRFQRLAIPVLLLAVAGAGLGSSVVAFNRGRSAMVRQVQLTEQSLAEERAAELATTAEQMVVQFRVRSAIPGLAAAFQRRDSTFLSAVIAASARSGAVTRVVATTPDGTIIAAQPAGSAMRAPDVGVTFVAGSGGRDALALSRQPVTAADGSIAGYINVEVSLARLLPRLLQPPRLLNGNVSIFSRNGTVLGSGTSEPGRVQAPELLAPVAAGRSASLSFHSRQLGQDRIVSLAPVAGTDVVLVVGANARTAFAPADNLARGLLVVLFVAGLTMGGLLLVVGLIIRSRRAGVAADRAAAVAMAELDPLTGLSNRRGLENAIGRAAASTDQHALLLFDLDGFKSVNDSCGHLVGDDVLRAVADALTGSVRPEDVVGRFGGDEFVILQPVSHTDVAAQTAQRARAAISGIDLRGVGPITASVGWATGRSEEVHDLLRLADHRLYAAKARLGRDREGLALVDEAATFTSSG